MESYPAQCNTPDGRHLVQNLYKSGAVPCNVAGSFGFEKSGVQTALGCLPTEPTDPIKAVIRFSIFAGSGIALLLVVIGIIQMTISRKNPESYEKGKEQLVDATIGFLIIIFAVFLLRIIGIDILGISPD